VSAHLDAFSAHRDRLFGLAYRMTGSVADAEDVCQDIWLRWSTVDLDGVRNTEAFLVSMATRRCLDRLGSATHRREIYVGPFLPEPIVTPVGATTTAAPDEAAELADSMTLAFLVLLDQLAPVERAAFLLHDVFGYPFDEVAAALDRTPDATRQLTSRARRRIDAERTDLRRGLTPENQAVLAALLGAIAAGDVAATVQLLAPGVVQLDDGGALVRAGRRPIVGPDRVARLWVNLAKRYDDISLEVAEVNGLPGLVFRRGDRPYMVVEVGIGPDGLVHRITSQLNPDKLAHLP